MSRSVCAESMNVIFKLRFSTRFGQRLFITGDAEALGSGDPSKAVTLNYVDADFWEARVSIPDEAGIVSYHYFLREEDGSQVDDWGDKRLGLQLEHPVTELQVVDYWNFAGFYENAFYTEPFQKVLLAANHKPVKRPAATRMTHIFRVKTPLLEPGATVCLLGNTERLGNWDTKRAVRLNRAPGEEFFSADVDLSDTAIPLEYKYGISGVADGEFLRFEDGANRVLRERGAPETPILLNDGFVRLPPPSWKGAGVAIPVFSLRSERSCGVGEFADLKLLADWAARVGLKLVQILPVNDTTATHTWLDSYPYSAISAFALHPIYLRLDETTQDAELLAELEPLRQKLNSAPDPKASPALPVHLDYQAVMEIKLSFLKKLFAAQGKTLSRKKDYQRFVVENRDWLIPYAAFCHFRDRFGTPDYTQWPEHSTFDAAAIERLAKGKSPAAREIAFHCFVQFLLHQQLGEAVAHAHSRGVILKGDIPIGVARFGADSWQQPGLYHMDCQAGAPPDAFAAKGQNWGFPTYNWERMQADGFAWWRRRFEQMSRYFDAFRIDHILGFFRIWSIPMDAVEGILGRFVRALPVLPAELEARGIKFDQDRFAAPWITDTVLAQIFGTHSREVRSAYLEQTRPGHYTLKPRFATQRLLENHFKGNSDIPAAIREGLFDLASNVILLAGGASGEYHFRYGMESTASFQALEADTQAQLRELYIDYFFRRQESFWMTEGMAKLPGLKRATNMLICGEDLGMVPACVPEALRRLGLLSLEVQRMPKTLNARFSQPAHAPYLSVVTPSTHDMSTVRGWWTEDRESTQAFFHGELGLPGTAPETCETWVNRLIIKQHLASPAMWSIFQLQDLLGSSELRWPAADDERINVPANPKHYWRYRMHLRLEELLEAEGFNRELREMISSAGR